MAKKEEKMDLVLGDDLTVPSVIEKLDEKLDSLKHITETKYRTSGVIEGVTDIKKETSIETLVRGLASIMVRKESYDRAAKELGLTTYPQYQIGGCSLEDWTHDIKFRIDVLTHKETTDKLKEYRDKMSKFLSEQDQKQMLLNEMSSFLKKLS